jgi:predicted transposase YdaD
MTESGNPKMYDQAFKYLAENDPRALLVMLGALPPDAAATVTRLPKELISSAVIPDELYLIEYRGERWIAHIEAQTRYASDVPVRLLDYAVRLRIGYDIPVRTFLLLLTKRGVPESPPTEVTVELGRLRITFGYEVVKLWELAATDFLNPERPALLPFVPLMAGGRDALAALPDAARRGELELHFLVLGGLRYDVATLIALLERSSMIPLEQLRESSIYQLILQEGKAEGRQEGRQEGREEGLERGLEQGLERERALVARLLRRKFSELPEDLVARVRALPREPLERLAEDLLDLSDLAALAAWLDRAE